MNMNQRGTEGTTMSDTWLRDMIGYIRHHFAVCFFIVLIFGTGIVSGAFAVRVLPEAQLLELADYLDGYLGALREQAGMISSNEALEIAMFHHMKGIFLIWLLGFTMIGIPCIFFLVFTQGFILGFTVGFFIHEYILQGALFAVMGVLPQQLLFVPSMLFTALCAVSLSILLIRRCMSRTTVQLRSYVVRYLAILPLMLLITVVGILVEVYVSPVLLKGIYGMFG
ncbi:MAG: stage II sporulation protein M [Selenomonadales bacterium]|nr:stage II sporulation protein M [Selenomonadales bacterium]